MAKKPATYTGRLNQGLKKMGNAGMTPQQRKELLGNAAEMTPNMTPATKPTSTPRTMPKRRGK